MDQQIPGSETLKRGMTKETDGKAYIYAYSAGALTAGDVVKLSYAASLNPRVAALADGVTQDLNVVATVTQTAAGWNWFQYRGACTLNATSATYTATHMLHVLNGAVASMGATIAYSDEEFAVVLTTVTGTEVSVYLMGRESVQAHA